MATNFPTSLDNLSNPAGSDPVNNPSHAVQHANVNDAIEALETKVGVTNSAVTTSLDYRVKQLETNPTYTNEMAQDAVAAALAAGTHTNITINYNDTGNSISISAAAGYTNEEAVDAVAAALTAGSGISISYNDTANTITISVDSTIATKTYVDTAITSLGNTAATTYVPQSDVGNIDGVASLDGTGKVPDSQIPEGIARDSEVSSSISTAINNLINSAPGTLDTLGEIATQLAADESAAAALTTVVNGKVSKAGGDIITSSLASTIPLRIKGAASQTANLQEWQDSAGNVLSSISSLGSINLSAGKLVSFSNGTVQKISLGYGGNYSIGVDDYTVVLTADNNGFNGRVGIRPHNATYGTGYVSPIELYANGQIIQRLLYSTTVGHIVKGAASQTANLQEWQNSAGTVLASISANGTVYMGSNGGANIATFFNGTSGYGAGSINASGTFNINGANLGFPYTASGAVLSVNATYAGSVPVTARGYASQTADLQQWQNSSGTVLSKVDASGAMFTITPADSTNTTQVATTAYVKSNINNLINSAPGALDTLNELAAALGNDASFSTTITNSLALKAPLASPTFTGTPIAPTATSGTNTTQIATTAFVKTAIDTSVQPGAVYQTSAPSSPAVGQIWIDSDDDVTTFDSNIIRRKAITATAGQTVFTADLPFIDGFEQIFMNGLLLVKTTDYATSGGNTVTLTSAAAASDIIEIVSVTGANSVNTYTQAETNALLAANTSVAPLSISANTTLVAKKRYFVTSASALTLTLPASPALNDEIQILDASGNSSTYNITVARNANKINGGNNNLIIDTNGGWYTLLYTGSTYGWKVG